MQKLYCFVDETGQDTQGLLFLVSVVITDKTQIEKLRQQLEKLERETQKGFSKWTKTPLKSKTTYIEDLLTISELKGNIYYATYHDTKNYILATTHTIAWSILEKTKGQTCPVNILIDGVSQVTARQIAKDLTQLGIRRRRVKGARFTSEGLIRLTDALVGFFRDYEEKLSYATNLYPKLFRAGMIIKRS